MHTTGSTIKYHKNLRKMHRQKDPAHTKVLARNLYRWQGITTHRYVYKYVHGWT